MGKKTFRPTILLILFTLSTILFGCSDSDNGMENSPGNQGSLVKAADGGTVTSADGQLSLVVPPGALAADTTIKISAASSPAAGRFIFKLEPDGLQFSQPAAVTVVLNQQQLAGIRDEEGNALDLATETPIFIGFLKSADGSTDLLSLAHAKTAGNGLSVTAEVGHFSDFILDLAGRTIDSKVNPTGEILVNGTFGHQLSFDINQASYNVNISEITNVYFSKEGTAADYQGTRYNGQELPEAVVTQNYVCKEPGKVRIVAQAVMHLRTYIENQGWVYAPESISYRSPETEITCVAPPAPPEPQVQKGVFQAPSRPERATVIRTMQMLFGANPTALYLMITGSNSATMIDLMTGLRVFTHDFGGYGALSLQENPAGPAPGTQFLHTYGPTGTTSTSFQNGNFGMTVLGQSPVIDAFTPYNAISDRFAEVSYSQGWVRWSVFNAVTRVFDRQSTPDFWAGSNRFLVSAQGGFGAGPLVAVADGSPGALFYGQPVADGASKIADVGNDPRQVRCLDGICVVTNYGSDSVNVFRWPDAAQPPTSIGSAAVGDGPIGVDLIRSGASVLALTTGFNDNSYSITTINQGTGEVLSNTKTVLSDCQGPGWGAFISATQAILTCNTDSTYKVFQLP